MKIISHLLLMLSVILYSCGVNSPGKKIRGDKEFISMSSTDLEKSVLNFSNIVLKDKLKVTLHERVRSYYFDIQMIFEADDWKSDHFNSYTSYSDKLDPNFSMESNYDGFILFVATYKDVKSAEHAFEEIKTNTKIRIAELEGLSGLLVEQVQIFERIRKSGGLFTQKDKYVFYLVKSCGTPTVGTSWNDYENLFLKFITEKNEEIEIINADCEKDEFLVQNIKAKW